MLQQQLGGVSTEVTSMQQTAQIFQFNRSSMAEPEDEASVPGGYVKLYRKLQDVSFKRDPERFALWVHMLLEASRLFA
jgi:hypothetical protein